MDTFQCGLRISVLFVSNNGPAVIGVKSQVCVNAWPWHWHFAVECRTVFPHALALRMADLTKAVAVNGETNI